MKTIFNKLIICLTIISTIGFLSCDESNDNLDIALSIEDKITLLESGEWLLKGFETNVMHTFVAGKKHTFYGADSVFSEEAIPGTQDYTIDGEKLMLDYNFGNISSYDVKFSCDNTIVEFYKEGELNTTLYKRNSNYQSCL